MESPELERQGDWQNKAQINRARGLLARPGRRDPAWPALAAAAFFALCAMTFAVTSIMTPARDYGSTPIRHGS